MSTENQAQGQMSELPIGQEQLQPVGIGNERELRTGLAPQERYVQKRRIIVVANKPYATPEPTSVNGNGGIETWKVKRADGGLNTGLSALWGLWVSLATEDPELIAIMANEGFAEALRTEKGSESFQIVNVPISTKEFDISYSDECNGRFWPAAHDDIASIEDHPGAYAVHRKVSAEIAKKIIAAANLDDIISIQDYHRWDLADIIREMRPDLKLAHFSHTPIPSLKTFKHLSLEEQRGIVNGMLANDMLGFHIQKYVNDFVKLAKYIHPDLQIEKENGKARYIHFQGRKILLGAYPISIDVDVFERNAQKPEVRAMAEKIREQFAMQYAVNRETGEVTVDNTKRQTLFVDVGRLDYTKGFLEGLGDLEYALDHDQDLQGKIHLIEVAHDSRLHVKRYRDLKQKIEAEVERINAKFRIVDPNTGVTLWEPVTHISKKMEQTTELLALYIAADVMRVIPRKDGMNLVIKEAGLVGREDMIEILSITAGAYEELQHAVIGVDPKNRSQIAAAIRQAHDMPRAERIMRKSSIENQIRENDVYKWMGRYYGDAEKHLFAA